MELSPFTVIQSTLSPIHLAKWVATHYGFTNVRCSVLKTHMNHSYRVTADGTDYVLRVYDHTHRDTRQVREETHLLSAIKHLVGVSYPIADVRGKLVAMIEAPEGTRHVVLFSFAQGRKVRNLPAQLHAHIGQEVGHLHASMLQRSINRFDYTTEYLVDWAYEQLIHFFSSELAEMKFIKACSPVLSKVFDNPALRRGIVHLDIWYDNFNITDEGAVTFFDFDNCGNGWLALDIGYYCMQLFYTEPDTNLYEEKKNAFISGYRSILTVSDEELELIPYAGLAIWIHYLGLHAQRFDNFANIFLSENFLKMMIGRVKGWLAYHTIHIPGGE